MIKKEEIIPMTIGVILIIFGIYASVKDVSNVKSLSRNLVYSKAAIVDFYSVKSGRYLKFTYYVDGKQYFGSGRHYPKSDTFSIGDSIRIVYDMTNPENSKPSRDHRAGYPIDMLLEIRQE